MIEEHCKGLEGIRFVNSKRTQTIYIYLSESMKWAVVLQQLGEESDAGKYKCGHQHMHVSCAKSKKSIRSLSAHERKNLSIRSETGSTYEARS